MSDDLNIKKSSKIKTKSTSVSGGGTDIDYVRPAELPEQDLYHDKDLVLVTQQVLRNQYLFLHQKHLWILF